MIATATHCTMSLNEQLNLVRCCRCMFKGISFNLVGYLNTFFRGCSVVGKKEVSY